MPRTLVLFETTNADSSTLANAVAEGARSVRFAEVDLRAVGEVDDFAPYDGIAMDASSVALRAMLERAGPLRSKVGALFGAPDSSSLLELASVMARAGMIILPPGTGESALSAADTESARVLGKRLADVVGWITHARSHHHH